MQLLKRTSVKKKQTSVINTDPHSSKTIPSHQKRSPLVAVSCGYGTCFAVKTCDELYHFIFSIDRVGITFGFQTIIWTFARHLVSRCLWFPTTGITWSILTNHRPCYAIFGSRWKVAIFSFMVKALLCEWRAKKSTANYIQRHHWTVKVCPKGTLILGKVRSLKFGCDIAHILALFML